jgi:hypothetical protein
MISQHKSTILFVLGTGRCGSTMLAEVLSRHPDIGFVSNLDGVLGKYNLKGRWNRLISSSTPSWLSQRDSVKKSSGQFEKSRFHFGPSEGWKLLSQQVSPIITNTCRDLTGDDVTPSIRKRFRAFFEERARVQGRPVFMHKLTEWPRARFVHEILPEAKFLHIVRDGRAVANSLIRMPWWFGFRGPTRWNFGPLPEKYQREWEKHNRSFLVLAGLEWKLMMDAFDETAKEIPSDQWMEIRYEDFVDQPREGMQQILQFAGLQWPKKFEREFSLHRFGENKKGFLRDLTGSQVAQLEEVIGEYLERRGYELTATRGSAMEEGMAVA